MEEKDLQRIMDIKTKSGGDIEIQRRLANKMAKLITDRDKCFRRFEAASHLLGPQHLVTQIFHRRWHVLHGTDLVREAPTAPPAEVASIKEAAPPEDAILFGSQMLEQMGEAAPADAQLRKGREKGVLEIWQSWTMQIIHIFRKGTSPNGAIGAIANFQDENGEFLFGGKMLDWTTSDNVEAAVRKYGKFNDTRSYSS